MSKKMIFSVILWVISSFSSALAQAPEQTTTESQPCWEKEVKLGISPENKKCYQQFLQEVDRQIKADAGKEVLEDLELAGVKFVKALGVSEVQAGEMVSGHFTELQLRNVPLPKQELSVSGAVVSSQISPPNPSTVVLGEVSGKQKEVCWEEDRPANPQRCLVQLDKTIERLKKQMKETKSSSSKKDFALDIKLLEIEKKRLKKYFDNRVHLARAVEKEQKREFEAEVAADVHCADGRAREEFQILKTDHLRYVRSQAFVRVTVRNRNVFPVRITAIDPNHGGPVVILPGGCNVTLSRSLDPSKGEALGYSGVNYYYEAEPLNMKDHQVGIARSQTYHLYPGNGYGQATGTTWIISNFSTQY